MQIRSSKLEAGFALILAIIALMLLTFLGLTLSLSTATETQVARNYSWSRQAHYNALAGAEVGRSVLTNALKNGVVADWSPFLPPGPRTGTAMQTPPALGSNSTRDWEGSTCDLSAAGTNNEYGRNGIGYGRVMTLDGTPTGTKLQDITTFPIGGSGQSLKGAFTVWLRRTTYWDTNTNQMLDSPNPADANSYPNHVIMTVEGVAPYVFTALNQGSGSTMRQQQAVQILEIDLQVTSNILGKNTKESNEGTGANRSLATDAVKTGVCANGTGGTTHTDTMGTRQ
jgi:hypothetical protein